MNQNILIVTAFLVMPMVSLFSQGVTTAKSAAKPSPVRAPSAPSRVENVIQLVKGGMSEELIIRSLRKVNLPIDLTTADLVSLKNAGVSERIITVMMDPASKEAPAEPPVSTLVPVRAGSETANTPTTTTSAVTPTAYGPSPAAVFKKRVVVDPFDYSAVMTSVQSIFGTQQNIGKGIQAMLVNRLHQGEKLIIVDRAKVSEVLAEQDFAAGNRVKQGTGSRIGRISGADAILAGDITIFGRDDKKKSGAATAMAGWCKLCGAVAASRKEEKAVVAITYRLIDAETTEVIATGEARGESTRKSTNWGVAIASLGNGGGAAAVDMTSTNFAETIIGEATQDCVKKLAEILTKQAQEMKRRVREVEAYVADINAGNLTIAAGTDDGVNVGEVFDILHVDREVKDPVTKEVLDRITSRVGESKQRRFLHYESDLKPLGATEV